MIEVLPATAAPDAAEAVLAMPGDGRTCWCQWLRLPRRDFGALTTPERRDRFRGQVREEGPGPGVVAFRDGEPVGWCAVAPRAATPVLERSRLFGTGPVVPGTWAVTCFVVPREHRRQGVAHALLDAAVDHARAHGAAAIDASPVDTDARPDADPDDLYHGTLALFVAHGFEEVARPSPTRPLVRRVLSPATGAPHG